MPIAHIATASPAGGINGATTGNIDSSGGDFAVMAVSSYFNSPTFSNDSKGNVYTLRTERGGPPYIRIGYDENATCGASHNFGATGTGMFVGVIGAAFGGVAASSSYDVENGSNSSGTPGSVTPNQNDSLLVAAQVNFEASATCDSGFTYTSLAYTAGSNMGLGFAYKIQTAASAENPSWSPVGSAGAIEVFKPASGGQPSIRRAAMLGLRSLEIGRSGSFIV